MADVDNDLLILVDDSENVMGFESKTNCHTGSGILHRAFSIFIFNTEGQLLLQKRSAAKPLWPLYWSNSVCSHPRKGETLEEATHRRLKEEMGIDTQLRFLFKFKYHAAFNDVGSENELCSVYMGKWDDRVNANTAEIAEWKYVDIPGLNEELRISPHLFTPWFKIEWESICRDHMETVEGLIRR